MKRRGDLHTLNPVCAHPYIRKGYYLGVQGDVYICVSCGEARPAENWDKFERRRAFPRGLLNSRS